MTLTSLAMYVIPCPSHSTAKQGSFQVYEVKYGVGKDLCPRTVFVVVFTYICNNETRENYDIELSRDDQGP